LFVILLLLPLAQASGIHPEKEQRRAKLAGRVFRRGGAIPLDVPGPTENKMRMKT